MNIARQLERIFGMIEPAPQEWFEGVEAPKAGLSGPSIPILPCSSYEELLGAWRKAMFMTDSIDITLSAMLATCASTKLQGSQVWLRVIGPAGSAKTTLCEALATCKEYTHCMSIVTGFHSGYAMPGAGGEDVSPILKILNKTAIINEGDMLLKAPNRDQTMAELRDLYSGVARNQYKNGKSNEYCGIRTTFILAGTPSLRQLNRSALGDRFLDCIIHEKAKGLATKFETDLVRAVVAMSVARCKAESDGTPESLDTPEKIRAYQMTGGYVAWLRQNVFKKIKDLEVTQAIVDLCSDLGQMVAVLRTRPDKNSEDPAEAELPTRLGEQLMRMAMCLAVVLDRPIDKEVMRRVAKIAKDTCFGTSYDIVRVLRTGGALEPKTIINRVGVNSEIVNKTLAVLLALECTKTDMNANRSKFVYRLSPQMLVLLSKLDRLLDQKV